MRHSLVKLAAIAALSSLSVSTADAAIITGTYTVTGNNFASLPVPPYPSITESFTISFNNAVTVLQQTIGISLNGSTLTPTSTLGFTYIAGLDALIVGGIAATVGASDPNSTDFALTINNASNVAGFGITSLSYTVGTGAIFTATTTTRVAAAAIPEPVSLALLGASVAMIALVRRRRFEK